MINTEITTTKGMEQAQKKVEQAKRLYAQEKKKANEDQRKRKNVHKYMMGGGVYKYFPECYCFEESEMNEILKVAIATPQCQKVIADIKVRVTNQVLQTALPTKTVGKRGNYLSPSVQKTHLPFIATSEQYYHKKTWQS